MHHGYQSGLWSLGPQGCAMRLGGVGAEHRPAAEVPSLSFASPCAAAGVEWKQESESDNSMDWELHAPSAAQLHQKLSLKGSLSKLSWLNSYSKTWFYSLELSLQTVLPPAQQGWSLKPTPLRKKDWLIFNLLDLLMRCVFIFFFLLLTFVNV